MVRKVSQLDSDSFKTFGSQAANSVQFSTSLPSKFESVAIDFNFVP